MFLLDTNTLGQDFFTVSSFGTLAGATFIVFAVCSGIQTAFNYNPKWLALIVSIVVSIIGAILSKTAPGQAETGKYIIALLNGFLIYASASGTNQIFGKDLHKKNGEGAGTAGNMRKTLQPEKRKLLTRWK